MGKITKFGEYSIGTPPYKPYERKRKRRRTKEEKEAIIKKFEQIINKSHPMLTGKVEEITEKERARQEKSLISDGIITKCNHEESIIDTDGSLVCRVKKKKDIKEKIKNLLCTHKKTIVQNGFLICVDCNEKVKKLVKNDRKK